MIGDYVRSLDGMALLGIIGLIASLAVFIGVVVRALRVPADHVDAMARLPLDDEHPVSLHHDEVAP
jgi:hypothetical protein